MDKKEIIETRKKLGLSQSDFARSLGVNTATVSHWEVGRNKPTTLHQITIKRLGQKAEEDSSVRDTIIGFAIAGGVTAFLAWLWSENNKK